MTDAQNQLRALVEALYSKTMRGELTWGKAAHSQAFVTNVAQKRLEISVEHGERGEDVWLNIYNSEGDHVDSISDTYFGTLTPARTAHSNYYSLMKELYDSADRNARGADAAISELLNELGVEAIGPDDEPPF